MKTRHKIAFGALVLSLAMSSVVMADPGDEDSGPYPVIVENWQTWYPKVTALKSLNAYMATSRGEQVYYVPTLEELPDIKNAVSDCVDYSGVRQRFAAVYDGYFNQMCYEALVRKSDGTYSKVPAIVQTEGSNSARELTTLGYDFLLTRESLNNVKINGESISAEYLAEKLDREHGYVDLNTALMDIYKAVGQEKYDIMYAFANDPTLTVENSPVQSEINLLLDKAKGIDSSKGQAWVFVTRTNPTLYWKQAAYDGVIWDGESLDGAGSNTKTERISLAEFCDYAYNIMNIYGEPVMTQSEKNILLQLYGSSVPYQSCTSSQVEAIETFIAKGIISPDEDKDKLVWNGDLDFDYMLTLLMRIKDTNARKTYKDVQITLDASLIKKDYYNANLEYEDSSIRDIKESVSAAHVTNYYDVRLGLNQFESMAQSINSRGVSMDLFIPTHLVIVGPDGAVFPLTTQVTTYSQKVYSLNHPDSDYVINSINPETDGQLMQFCISDGVHSENNQRFLHLRVAAFPVNDLLHDDGMYHLHLVNDRGEVSGSAFTIKPGGGVYYESGVRDSNDDDVMTDWDDNYEYSNQSELDELVEIYEEEGEGEAQRRLNEMLGDNPDWTLREIEAAMDVASSGEYLAAEATSVVYMTIDSGSEGNINVTMLNGQVVKLSDVVSQQAVDGAYLLDKNNPQDLVFRKINSTTYQIENCKGKNDLMGRVTSVPTENFETAFCRRDEDLLVSTDWLIKKGLLTSTPIEHGGVLMLSTQYSNIYLDNVNKYIVVGACVYGVQDLDASEIWMKSGNDTYVNFRAVLGWTGDFMIFKNTGGNISVSMQDSPSFQKNWANNIGDYTVPIHMSEVTANAFGLEKSTGNTVDVQGVKLNKGDKTTIPMTGMYPFANYFIYINEHVLETSTEYHDWLFVFKPKDVKVNGNKLDYDDSASREWLHNTMGVDVSKLDQNITVWAYPLYRKELASNDGMPREMTYSRKYGYMYNVQRANNMNDVIAAYWNTDAVLRTTGEPEFVLPYYVDGDGHIQCFNHNVYTCKDSEGNDVMLDYGQVPVIYLRPIEAIRNAAKSLYNMCISPFSRNTVPIVEEMGGLDMKGSRVSPTITSPALWFLELQKYDFETVASNLSKGSQLFWGTLSVNITGSGSNRKIMVGSEELPVSMLKNYDFLLMRETASTSSTVGRWFSVSALTSFDLEPIVEDGTGTENLTGPVTGKIDSTVDTIDWEEFKFSRIIEEGEFIVSIATIFVLNILPRVALFLFLLLTALGCVQNVKLVQLFCDRIFDPYKFLTAGRKDVHTFRSGRAFLTSIIAMGVYALFMDGTIIHVYEWIMQFIGAFLGK